MKKYTKSIVSMSDEAYYILRSAVIITCVMLICSLVTIIVAGGLSVNTYSTYYYGIELLQLPQAVLIVALLTSVIAESIVKGK
jgi:hypothetical protein